MSRLGKALGWGETPLAPRAGLIGGMIAVVAAAMAFMAISATIAADAANRVAGRWSEDLAAVATVRIAAPADRRTGAEPLPPPAETAAAALSVLAQTDGVASARLMKEDEVRALLAPWLGGDADIGALPLPLLIDVVLEGGGPDPESVQRQLALQAPGASYDDHGAWRGPLLGAARGLRRIAAAGVALSLLSLATMIAISAAATLWSGAGVVRTLRLIGAEDRFIARAFERPFAVRAAIGGGVGAAAALAAAERLPRLDGATAFGLAPWDGPNWWLVLFAPAVAGLVALAATRLAAVYVLRRG